MTKIGLCVIAGMLATGAEAMADQAAKPAPTSKPTTPAPAMPPPVMPTPAKELDAVKPLLRNWSCANKDKSSSGKLVYKKDLSGFWYNLRLDIKKSKVAPAFTGYAVFGVDPIKHDWVMEGFDSMGGTLHLRSKDGLAWTGTSVDQGKESPASLASAFDAKTKHHTVVVTIDGNPVVDYDCK